MEAACRRGDLEAVKTMVSIDIRRAYTPDANGITPIHRAAAGNHVEVIEFLLANHADPNALDRYGDSPLKRASYDGYVDSANVLISAGADVNRADSLGKTPLHHAAERGHVQVLWRACRASVAPCRSDPHRPHAASLPITTLVAAGSAWRLWWSRGRWSTRRQQTTAPRCSWRREGATRGAAGRSLRRVPWWTPRAAPSAPPRSISPPPAGTRPRYGCCLARAPTPTCATARSCASGSRPAQ